MSQKKVIAILLALTFVFSCVLAGCGGDNTADKKAEKVITYNLGASPETMDPAMSTGLSEATIQNAMFEGLYRYDADKELQPAIAEKVDISEDGLNYVFTIKKDVKWSNGDPLTAQRYLPELSREEQQVLVRQLENRFNTVLTSSCGRLFDAVSALLGICTKVQYEGQAAIEMETLADVKAAGTYSFELCTGSRPYTLGVRGIFQGILADLSDGTPVSEIAGRFHSTIAEMIIMVLKKMRENTGLNLVALSGGVFQNKLLFLLLRRRLAEEDFRALCHKKVPTNDGGVSLGQVYIASEVIRKDVSCHSIQDLED
jgi:hydrogenase maturation factor HypF (carbamoyltransferase family)